MTEDVALAPGRECGSCTVCCILPKIDDPALQKQAGVRCANLTPAGGCAVYETRPGACRAFFCGWRYLPQLEEGWRPDRAGVLISFIPGEHSGYPKSAFKITTWDRGAVLQPFVLAFVADVLGKGLPLYFAYAPGAGPAFKTFLNARVLASTGAEALAASLSQIMGEQAAAKSGTGERPSPKKRV